MDFELLAKEFGDIKELLDSLDRSLAPEELKEECRKMIVRIYRMAKRGSYSSEYESVSKYINSVVSIPWRKEEYKPVDINTVRTELDRYHYGLREVKENILSYMAVMQLREKKIKAENLTEEEKLNRIRSFNRPPVFCFVGLQGLGKTTIAKSIACAMGRPFQRISMAAFGDISQLRGRPKVYPDAEPGLIIQALIRAGKSNPVILLDEIDKASGIESLRVDIMSALLEVLDPSQNDAFVDRYINFPVDLSQVFFITTANTLGTLTAALLDRLEIIRFTSYSDEEKTVIAKNYLMPRVMKACGLSETDFTISEDSWPLIVRPMGYDAGIRQLERTLMNLARRVGFEIISGEVNSVSITPENVKKYLPEDMGVIG